MNIIPATSFHWIRQSNVVRKSMNERDLVYQISKISPGEDRPMVIASCSKLSAQKFLAKVALQSGPDRYRITATFVNPPIPGLEPAMER